LLSDVVETAAIRAQTISVLVASMFSQGLKAFAKFSFE